MHDSVGDLERLMDRFLASSVGHNAEISCPHGELIHA